MRFLRSPLLTVAVLPLAACMTWTQIPVPRISSDVRPTDVVRIGTFDGREVRFTVTEVEPAALVGEDVRVELSRIQWLKRREFEAGKTFGNIGNAALVVAGVVVLFALVCAVSAAQDRYGQ
ncbi:MAG: hypothetical protein ABFS86_03910 [Planctomycetota bacterium]